MYDKVSMWIDRCYFDNADYKMLDALLTNARVVDDLEKDKSMLTGSYNGLKVRVYDNSVYIVGSLSKCHYTSNCYTLTRSTTKEVIQHLSDAFKFNPDDARVSTLEFGTMFPMKAPTYKYIKMLGEMPRMERIVYPNLDTLYYANSNNKKVLRFYDKGKEAIKHNISIPPGLEDANLLRYEVALNKRIKQHLKVAQITASTLYDKEFYNLMKRKYREEYEQINKIAEMGKFNLDSASTPKEVEQIIIARALQDPEVREELQRKKFENRSYNKRLKEKVKEYSRIEIESVSNQDLINELNDCILNIEDYP